MRHKCCAHVRRVFCHFVSSLFHTFGIEAMLFAEWLRRKRAQPNRCHTKRMESTVLFEHTHAHGVARERERLDVSHCVIVIFSGRSLKRFIGNNKQTHIGITVREHLIVFILVQSDKWTKLRNTHRAQQRVRRTYCCVASETDMRVFYWNMQQHLTTWEWLRCTAHADRRWPKDRREHIAFQVVRNCKTLIFEQKQQQALRIRALGIRTGTMKCLQ